MQPAHPQGQEATPTRARQDDDDAGPEKRPRWEAEDAADALMRSRLRRLAGADDPCSRYEQAEKE